MSANQMVEHTESWEISDGLTVYGLDGDKLGTVRNYDPESGYLDIQKGWLFHKDFFVGLAAIASVDEHGITLHLTEENLKDDRFASPPMRGGFAYSGGVVNQKEPAPLEDEAFPVTRESGGPIS